MSSTDNEQLSQSTNQLNDGNSGDCQSLHNIDFVTEHYAPLLQNPNILRTINFLSHLLDSRLTTDWRLPLEYWQRNCAKLNYSNVCQPPLPSPHEHTTTTATNTSNTATALISGSQLDVTDSTPVHSYTTKTTSATQNSLQSPEQEVCAVKRCKLSSSSNNNNNSINPQLPTEVGSKANKPFSVGTSTTSTTDTITKIPSPSCSSSSPSPSSSSLSVNYQSQPVGSIKTPTTFITARLILSARNLADHFESRYRDKLGSLLEDVARLNNKSGNINETESVSNREHEGTAELMNEDTVNRNYNITTTTNSNNNNNKLPEDSSNSNMRSSHDVAGAGADGGGNSNRITDTDSLNNCLEMSRCQFHSVLEELFNERINWGRIIAMLAFLRALCEVVEANQRITQSSLSSSSQEKSNERVSNIIDTSSYDTQVLPSDSSFPSCSYKTPSTGGGDDGNESPNKKIKISSIEEQYQSSIKEFLLSPSMRPCVADYVLWTAEFIHGPRELWSWISSHGNWEGLIDFESQRHEANQLPPTSDASSLIGLVTGFTDDETLRSLRTALTSVATIAVGAVGLVAAYHFLSKRL
ncbi:unnamed protein product [Trichobilharzia szidati]|nr:unnamed protein product [Trichobilharzia szidati]